MARLIEIGLMETAETVKYLSNAGLTLEVFKQIRQPGGAERAVAALQREFASSSDTVSSRRSLSTPPDEQITSVRTWNKERGWGFTEQDFEKLGSPPTVPDEPLVAVVLVPYLPDLIEKEEKKVRTPGYLRTFEELWMKAASRQERSWRWDGYDNADEKRLKLLEGIEHTPGLRWEVLDFGANRGKAPRDVRNQKTSPHAGILAAAALHPEWVRSMDGDQVPYVWLPGYEVTVPDYEQWTSVPFLHFYRYDREVRLLADRCDVRDGDWAVPVRREC